MSRWHWVRHGPTHAKGMIGWTDLPADLSDLDRLRRLAAGLPEDAVVVSSDLCRAVATADALQGARPRLPHCSDLREIHFGAWETRLHDDVHAETPDLIRAFWDAPGDAAPPGGESWRRFSARVNAAVDRIAQEHAGRDIIAVAHFGVILTQIERALGVTTLEAFGHRVQPLSLTQVCRTSNGWQAERINHCP